MRLVLVTDAWHPQVNGVVRTLSNLRDYLIGLGDEVIMVTPELFFSLPCPTYPEIRLSLFTARKIRKIFTDTPPDAVHIATEGPLGIAARRYCVKNNIPFTTAFHTRFAEYVHARIRLPLKWGYAGLRWFHRPSRAIMVATPSLQTDLENRGFQHIRRWTRGIDTELFHPREKDAFTQERPIFLYVGRVAVEKNIEDFLNLDLPGTKVVVGDGPQRKALEKKYPQTAFLGMKEGEELAEIYAAADVFIFPSRTDTFGLVLLEALACGVPVAAYPVTGPLDVIGDHPVGVLDEDLKNAAIKALDIDPATCRDYALGYSWATSANQFKNNLVVFTDTRNNLLTPKSYKKTEEVGQ
ncbi:glycosyltransferase family 4 protein [Sneathiella litorea]|uniref:Glycosyltransferase n=1 Tax=Sneathiella litorea TaxID=2606216 RepID=A0A6L8W997_9PROT|nr:glycosyltransferase family 1 protein [Sneathiella litorea]MZR31708.1 glycosyltransferase [Sneathiella litorea]